MFCERFASDLSAFSSDAIREESTLIWSRYSRAVSTTIRSDRVVIFNNLRQQRQACNSLRCNDAMLGQMCSKGIDKLRALTDEEVSRREEHGAGLLGFSLWNDEPHRRPGRCFNDRFCIGRIILMPFDKGLNVGRRNQANMAAKFADLTRPVMRCRAGLHSDDALGQFREECDDLAARQFPGQDNTAIASGGMNLKHPLC